MGCILKINACKIDNTKHLGNKNVSFTSVPADTEVKKAQRFVVKNQNIFKKLVPVTSFVAAFIAATAYLVGSVGLFYDIYKDKQNNKSNLKLTDKQPKTPKQTVEEDGAKTIVANTKFANNCMKFAKVGIMASATSGMACGIGEGMPIMALGEATNLGAGNIIETPLGTGLFGVGIASIFSSYALDNTPRLKLNPYKVLAEDSVSKKAKLYLQNIGNTVKEVFKAMGYIATNFYKPEFLKENLFTLNPKNLIIQELTKQDGTLSINKTLRHNRNIMLHAASFVLGLGGSALIATSLIKKAKKAQKAALKFEEGGFLVDNFGMTKIGLDKLTTGAKTSGSNFALGGVINAISQFMGIDNKDGRAMQWLGIFFVFVGFSIDRGKFMTEQWGKRNSREALTDVVREWKFDLSKIFTNKAELKTLLKEIKNGSTITNERFNKLYGVFESNLTKLRDKKEMETAIDSVIGVKNADNYKLEFDTDYTKVQEMLKKCSNKIFGPVPEIADGAKA